MTNIQQLTVRLKEKARALGFDACGVAGASELTKSKPLLSEWLNQGYQGKMAYMGNHFDKRLDPRLLVPGARSVVVVAQNYYPAEAQPEDTQFRIARYAYGKDYHPVMKDKLQALAKHLTALAADLTEFTGEHHYRVFTDSAPVLERSWAQEAGLGQHGKNTCLIIPRKGSYYFLGELITSMALESGTPYEKDLCGSCTRCMDACPTGAITAAGRLDARRCISYLTIELKDPIPGEFRNQCGGWIFGCDICQEVCPHNRHAQPHREPTLKALPAITGWSGKQWASLSKTDFNKHLRKTSSALVRVRYEKLMDNIACAAGKT